MPSADLILQNASIITMDAGISHADTVVISGNRILCVGSEAESSPLLGEETRVIDCRRKTVMPGFIDAHCHLFSLIRKLVALDVGPAAACSIADIKEIIREKARRLPAGDWIAATGYNEFYLAEKRHPTRWELDDAAPDNPVVVAHRSLHSCVLNSPALKLAGIGKDTTAMPGTLIERDEKTGEPNGVLYEMLGYIREKVMPPVSAEEISSGIRLANEQLLSTGITSLQDVSITNDFNRWETLRRRQESGEFLPRIAMATSIENLPTFPAEDFKPEYGDDRLRFLGIKIIPSFSTGQLYPPQIELNRMVLEVQMKGYPVLVHAVTREMVEAVITAFEFVKRHSPHGLPVLQRIEHCAECPPPLLERLSMLKPVIVGQPLFIYYNGDRYSRVIDADRLPWLFRFKAFHETGLVVAAGSDFPVIPHEPLKGIYAAVTRQTETGNKLVPGESISIEKALAMYTINAACAAGEGKIKGSLTPGKLADLAVLGDNPLEVSPEKIKDIKVEMTIINGKVVWEKQHEL